MARFGADQTNVQEARSFDTVKDQSLPRYSIIEDVTNIFDKANVALKENTRDKKEQTVSRFRGELLTIVEGVEQGSFSAQAGRSRMRTLYSQYNQDYGQLGNELSSAYGTVLSQSGMGRVMNPAIRDEIRRESLVDALYSEGRLTPGASKEQEDLEIQNLRLRTSMQEDYQMRMQTLQLQMKQLELDSTEYRQAQAQIESQSKAYGFQQVPFLTSDLSTISQRLSTSVQDGTMTIAEAQVAFSESFEQGKVEASGWLQHLKDSDRKEILDLYQSRFELEMKRISGGFEDSEIKRQLESNKARIELSLYEDPTLGRLATINKALGDSAVQILAEHAKVGEGARAIAEWLDTSSETLPNLTSGQRNNLNAYFKVLDNLDTTTPEGKREADSMLSKFVEGLEASGYSLSKKASRGTAVAEYLASPGFLKTLQANPEAFEDTTQAASILKEFFADEVYTTMSREFLDREIIAMQQVEEDNGIVYSMENVGNAPGFVAPVVESGRIKFVPTSALPDATNAARDSNKRLAPLLNTAIRASAHLDGNTNYEQYATQALDTIFEKEGLQDSSPENDISAEEIRSSMVGIEPLESSQIDTTYMGRLPGRSFKSTPKMESVEGIIMHHTAGRGSAEHVASVLVERGLSAHFVIDRDGVVHQFMPDDKQAWHAGVNNTSGYDNRNTIGVEIIAKDNDDVTPVQIDAARQLSRMLADKHGFSTDGIKGHGEVATHKRPTEGQAVVETFR